MDNQATNKASKDSKYRVQARRLKKIGREGHYSIIPVERTYMIRVTGDKVLDVWERYDGAILTQWEDGCIRITTPTQDIMCNSYTANNHIGLVEMAQRLGAGKYLVSYVLPQFTPLHTMRDYGWTRTNMSKAQERVLVDDGRPEVREGYAHAIIDLP